MKVTIDIDDFEPIHIQALKDAIEGTEVCTHKDDRAILPHLYEVLRFYMGDVEYAAWRMHAAS